MMYTNIHLTKKCPLFTLAAAPEDIKFQSVLLPAHQGKKPRQFVGKAKHRTPCRRQDIQSCVHEFSMATDMGQTLNSVAAVKQ